MLSCEENVKKQSAVDYLWNVLCDCQKRSWLDLYGNWELAKASYIQANQCSFKYQSRLHTNDITKLDGNFVRVDKGSLVQLMPFQTDGSEA